MTLLSVAAIAAAVSTVFAAEAQPGGRGIVGNASSPYVMLKSLDLEDVRWTAGFWADRFDVVRNSMLPVLWRAMDDPENGAQYASFLKTVGRGGDKLDSRKLNWWSDGDVYKTVEAMALVYASTKDKELDRRMDEIIAVFHDAQEADGYLSTPIKLKGADRWEDLQHHELYNMGHLMTAACVHYRATRKRNFLDVAIKVGDYLYAKFQPQPKNLAHFGFNPSNIMGATELYRSTGDRKYLKLAQTFVNMRGSAPGGSDLNQSRIPLRKEEEAVGHAVTAMYLYAGATDVYGETGEKPLLDALERIWTDVSSRKVYVTGAVGNLYKGASRRNDNVHEAFGLDYELPNRFAYTETCANIAHAMWNWRLLGLAGDAKYADLMEQVLYNSMLSGMDVSGRAFYYSNPLRRHGEEVPRVVRRQDPPLRSTVLPCYCCPTNIARTIAELRGWSWSKTADALWLNLFGGSQVDTAIAGGNFALTEKTDYPWDGLVTLTVDKAPAAEAGLMLRIPAWAQDATVQAAGDAPRNVAAGSYARLRRVWKPGDRVELRLPMKARLVIANPYVESARNQVAVMRGPLVYAVESPDMPAGVRVSEVALAPDARFRERFDKNLLGGVLTLIAEAQVRREGDWAGVLYKTLKAEPTRRVEVSMIPYYAWANRGMSNMTVWIPLAY